MLRVLALLFALIFFPRIASAEEAGWVIDNFHSEIVIPQSGRVQVVETIALDFGLLAKHGILRSIPTEGIRFRLREIKQDGVKAKTDVSSSSGYTTIKIGDPDQTTFGKHIYEISYEVGKVITRFGDHDEFYWNVTGDSWEVPIQVASAAVTLEGGEIQQALCFTGYLGSQEQNCTAKVRGGGYEFETLSPLHPGEGLTIVSSLSPGIVQDPFYLGEFIMPYWLILGSLPRYFLSLRVGGSTGGICGTATR